MTPGVNASDTRFCTWQRRKFPSVLKIGMTNNRLLQARVKLQLTAIKKRDAELTFTIGISSPATYSRSWKSGIALPHCHTTGRYCRKFTAKIACGIPGIWERSEERFIAKRSTTTHSLSLNRNLISKQQCAKESFVTKNKVPWNESFYHIFSAKPLGVTKLKANIENCFLLRKILPWNFREVSWAAQVTEPHKSITIWHKAVFIL